MPVRQAPPCPEGQCEQCWYHAHVLHAGNWLGLVKEEPCGPCIQHARTNCGKPKFSWW